MKLKDYVYSSIAIDEDFKKSLQKRVQARYKKKSNIFSKIGAWILGGVVLGSVALASPMVRENITNFFNSQPLYTQTKTAVIKSNFSSARESGRFLILSQSGSKDIILVASGSDVDQNLDIFSGKNMIFLTQNIDENVQSVFDNTTLSQNFDAQLQAIVKKYLSETNNMDKFNNWDRLLSITMNVKEKNGLVNIFLDHEYNEGGANPETLHTSLWFDKKTGQMVDIENILKPNGLENLSKYINSSLLAKYPNIEKNMINNGTQATKENYQLLFLSGDQLNLMIPQYQALPRYLGDQVFQVPNQISNL